MLIVTEYFWYDSRVDPSKHKHEDYNTNMENDRKNNEYPKIRVDREGIKETHPDIDDKKSSNIIFGLRDHKTILFSITIVGYISKLMYFIFRYS